MECLRALLAANGVSDAAFDDLPEAERREWFERARCGLTSDAARAMEARLRSKGYPGEGLPTMPALVEWHVGHALPEPAVWPLPQGDAVSHTPALEDAYIDSSGRLSLRGVRVFDSLASAATAILDTLPMLGRDRELRRRSLLSQCLQACFTCGLLDTDPVEAAGESGAAAIGALGGPKRARAVAAQGVPCLACMEPRGHGDASLSYCHGCVQQLVSVATADGTGVMRDGRLRAGRDMDVSEQAFVHRLSPFEFRRYCEAREAQTGARALRAVDPCEAALSGIEAISVEMCPGGCGRKIYDWEACAAITCPGCETHFCGLCLRVFDNSRSCHEHVPDCARNPRPGSVFVSDTHEVVRKRVQGRIAAFATQHCAEVRKRADEILDHDFRRPEKGTQTLPPLGGLLRACDAALHRAYRAGLSELLRCPPKRPRRRKAWWCVPSRR